MVSYSYNKDQNLFLTKAEGSVVLEDILKHYQILAEDDTLPRTLRVLIDCRGADFIFDPEEIDKTVEGVRNAIQKYHSITEAIIVGKPFEMVTATLFKEFNTNRDNYRFNIFSTLEAAMTWLG